MVQLVNRSTDLVTFNTSPLHSLSAKWNMLLVTAYISDHMIILVVWTNQQVMFLTNASRACCSRTMFTISHSVHNTLISKHTSEYTFNLYAFCISLNMLLTYIVFSSGCFSVSGQCDKSKLDVTISVLNGLVDCCQFWISMFPLHGVLITTVR